MSSSFFSPSSGIEVSLNDEKKWSDFYPRTEMIVTRKRGRVIFPHLDYRIKGLDANALYSIFVHLERVDSVKYKFGNGQWQYAAKGDPMLPVKYFEHPDGARNGEHWMKEMVSFAALKITNDIKSVDPRMIIVQSMHKYQPVVTIRKIGGQLGEEFRLGLTEFMTVTAYQCEQIIELKKKHNKFASGHRSERKRRQSSSESPEPKRTPSVHSNTSSPDTPPLGARNYIDPPVNSYGLQFPPPMFYGGMNPMYYGANMWNGYGNSQMNCVWPNGYQQPMQAPTFDENGTLNL